ncbi:MAG: hypothetical protein WC511_07135 [Candidatus Pacearchaeota archaeon]|jgi:hypothetical protein
MIEINRDIISQIEGLPSTSKELKDFLLSILDFEHRNLDKEMPLYKTEIEKELDKVIKKIYDNLN